MKLPPTLLPLLLLLGAPLSALAQVTVTSDQLGFGVGARRDYATHLSASVAVDGLIMPAGGPHHWDFSTGPSDDTFRHRVMAADDSGVDALFPIAELAEVAKFDSADGSGYTLFRLTAAGRELHGFYDAGSNPASPAVVFDPPFVDYPATMDFEDEWDSTSSYETVLDLPGLGVFDVAVDVTTHTQVDAYGTMSLPQHGQVEVLRINELSTFNSVADVDGIPVSLGSTFVRGYFWIARELGIVAQITSGAGTEVPGVEFPTASRILRLIARTPPGGDVPANLRIAVADGRVTLTWDAQPECSYQVFSSTDLTADSWQLRATVPSGFFLDLVATESLFYRLRKE